MPTVDVNRLKGNFGAAYVSSRLSSECLVRPVAADTDVGVDLYCETVENAQPFLHFWVQVKAGSQCRVSQDGESASSSFEGAHLEYWAHQPVPVFAALVPCEWPVRIPPPIYIIHISIWLVENDFDGSRSTTLHSHEVWQPNDRLAMRQFLEHTVPAATVRLSCRNGVVPPIPSQSRPYEFATPTGPIERFKKQILRQVRRTSAFSILHLFRNHEFSASSEAFRRTLASIVAQFPSDEHWENFMGQALSLHADGDFEQAVKYYGRAIACIRNDQRVAQMSSWQERVKMIEKLQDGATNRVALERLPTVT